MKRSACAAARPGSEALIFGTDGIRGRPGEGLLAGESLDCLVDATVCCLRREGALGRGPGILVARDTRESGKEIVERLARQFCLRGCPVEDLGVLPTPGAAFIASRWEGTGLAVMVSASHNPAEYNGIKFLASTGAKVPEEFERAVTEAYWVGAVPEGTGAPANVVDRSAEALEAYVEYLVGACRHPERLRGRTVALDTANGATFLVAPEVFRRLGLRVETLAECPDGRNINDGCGALHPEYLAQKIGPNADFSFCFDGDGDRVIPVSGEGTILDGDHVLFLAARSYRREGRLPRGTVVATVMSNVGLEIALKAEGLDLLRTDVGDRHVYRAMVEGGHPIGGEQSGHIIFLDGTCTGDGILAALRLLDVLDESLDLERESTLMKCYPQLLRNVKVAQRRELAELPLVSTAVERASAALGAEGRILLRYSGTEPLLRVMLEGPDDTLIESLCADICEAVEKSVGA